MPYTYGDIVRKKDNGAIGVVLLSANGSVSVLVHYNKFGWEITQDKCRELGINEKLAGKLVWWTLVNDLELYDENLNFRRDIYIDINPRQDYVNFNGVRACPMAGYDIGIESAKFINNKLEEKGIFSEDDKFYIDYFKPVVKKWRNGPRPNKILFSTMKQAKSMAEKTIKIFERNDE